MSPGLVLAAAAPIVQKGTPLVSEQPVLLLSTTSAAAATEPAGAALASARPATARSGRSFRSRTGPALAVPPASGQLCPPDAFGRTLWQSKLTVFPRTKAATKDKDGRINLSIFV